MVANITQRTLLESHCKAKKEQILIWHTKSDLPEAVEYTVYQALFLLLCDVGWYLKLDVALAMMVWKYQK